MFTDWLGNELREGDEVLYTSKSTHVGMNKGILLHYSKNKAQVRIPVTVWSMEEKGWRPGFQTVTLQSHTGAYNSVTRYYGPPT